MSRPNPTPSPAAPAFVAHLAQLAEMEATGRAVLHAWGYAELANAAWRLHSAVFFLQSDGVRGAEAVDIGEIENVASLFETLRDEQAGGV